MSKTFSISLIKWQFWLAKLKEFFLWCARQPFQAIGIAYNNFAHLIFSFFKIILLLENFLVFESSVDIKKSFRSYLYNSWVIPTKLNKKVRREKQKKKKRIWTEAIPKIQLNLINQLLNFAVSIVKILFSS